MKENTAHITDSVRNAHSQTFNAVAERLNVNPTTGLAQKEVQARIKSVGLNIIQEKRAQSPWIIFLSQFKGPFVIMLALATGISFWFREYLDAVAILIVLLVNAVIGFIMEYKAERSMDALKKLTTATAKVLREGKTTEISSDQIVPGDILIAEAGDIVLADARVMSCVQLQADESTLTGESIPSDKKETILQEATPLAERMNMLYKGTFITKGNVHAIVTATGMQTELGHIAAMVQGAEQTETPLEKKIVRFSKKILWLTIVLIGVIFTVGLLKGENVVSIVQTSIALAVAAIPEGLPIVTTLALAQGMLQMSRRNVLIKKLAAVETLGDTNVICTDKTGTLTQNKIEVNTISIPGASAEFRLNRNNRSIEQANGNTEIGETENYKQIQRIMVLCNTAEISVNNDELKELGDPLETGLLKFAFSCGINIETVRQDFPKINEEPFTSETKVMATLHQTDRNYFIAAKGAVEEILSRCNSILRNGTVQPFDDATRQEWVKNAEQLALSGLKVIAMASKETAAKPDTLAEQLVFLGVIGLLDPPRPDVFDALAECKSAGIDVVMITGDHPATARNIGDKLGLTGPENVQVMHGNEMQSLEQLSGSDKLRWLNTRIFARVTPKQKLDLVKLLQQNHRIVGMTGDGVNDAPALKQADIGIAMGLRGTQVAQEVSDMILKDDSFSSIVIAIKRGRIIFENIRKFIMYLLSCNLSELFIIAVTSIMTLHYAFVPLQILYINLITDVLPALALGVTRGSDQIMKQPPRHPSEQIIDRRRWISIIVYSLVIAACSLCAVWFTHFTLHKEEGWNPVLCNNILFLTLIMSQLWHAFNVTTDNTVPIYKTDVFRNRYVWYAIGISAAVTFCAYFIGPVARALTLFAPSASDLAVVLGFSLLSMVVNRVLKRFGIIL